MTTKLVPIFKAGKHISASGQVLDATPEFCEELVASYNKDVHQAPFCYGHPKDNAPAGAWASSLVFQKETGMVFAEPEVVDSDLVDNLKSGRYRFPSASIYMPDSPTNPTPGKPYLRHVAVLGAQAPAVKGVGVVSLNEADEGVFTFAEEKVEGRKGFLSRVLASISKRFGDEATDAVIADADIGTEAVAASDASPTPPAAAESASTTPDASSAVQTPATATAASDAATTAPATTAAPAADFAEHTARLAAKEAELASREAALRQQEAQNFCEGVIRDGRVRAADKEAVLGLFNALSSSSTTVDFAEGAEPALDVFKSFLQNMPKLVEFGEVAPAQDLTPPTVNFKAAAGYTVNPQGLAQLALYEDFAAKNGVDLVTAIKQFKQ
ncbi:phage protease [Burkholderia pseudomallei]|uniref:phage protease n=1 Tax=Burkholderia pseudomallei TaxID=28450 RepID=UPI00193D6FBB|nr:phage protease [Burkholderia pseudomallei]QRM23525.1 hypothetical protein JQX71_04370 [Burkholderia pseudomallei]